MSLRWVYPRSKPTGFLDMSEPGDLYIIMIIIEHLYRATDSEDTVTEVTQITPCWLSDETSKMSHYSNSQKVTFVGTVPNT